MADVVNASDGTGKAAKIDGIIVAGKTGTAQVVKEAQGARTKETALSDKNRDHGWFMAFAPVDHPKIAIACIIEHSGHGGSTAAPVVKAVMEKYFELNPPQGGSARDCPLQRCSTDRPAGRLTEYRDRRPKLKSTLDLTDMAEIDRRIIYHFDWTLFSLALALSGVGMLSVVSATWGGKRHGLDPLVMRQLRLGRRRHRPDDGCGAFRLSIARNLCLRVLCARRRDAGGRRRRGP